MADPQAELRQYDPALAEAARELGDEEDVAIIARISDDRALPPGVRVITRFGDIATLRAKPSQIPALAENTAVVEMEASQRLMPAFDEGEGFESDEGVLLEGEVDRDDSPYTRRPDGLTATGKGVVVGVLDWGCDFAHPAFRNEDGSTRLLALWDQRSAATAGAGNRWGYGRILTPADIDRALREADPYSALGYHPADADEPNPKTGVRTGAHGSHVLDICAGNGRGGGMRGVAFDAQLVFVHLAHTADVLSRKNLGDSASLLEALDFVFSIAEKRPCAVNMSVGAHGGPHDGTTLVEQGIDRAVWLERGGRVAVNSVGNYAVAAAHRHGRLRTGEEVTLEVQVPGNARAAGELELWYPALDRLTATIIAPDGTQLARVAPGTEATLSYGGRIVGRVYHVRAAGNGDHQVDWFLRPDAPAGVWTLRLRADHISDGRYHAWIEREPGPRPRFVGAPDILSTTGTLCNGRFSISVGAYDPHDPDRRLGRFSSAGPTRDGRAKPEIVAPGVRIRAARSTPRGEAPGARFTTKSGTSMAAPHVTGTVAVMFEAAAGVFDIADMRALLLASADRAGMDAAEKDVVDVHRLGYGYLDSVAAERVVRHVIAPREAEALPIEHHAFVPEQRETVFEAEDWRSSSPWEGSSGGSSIDVELGSASTGRVPAWEPANVEPSRSNGGWNAERPFKERLFALVNERDVRQPADLEVIALTAVGHSHPIALTCVAAPRSLITDPARPGDLLVRVARAEGLRYSSVVLTGDLESAHALVARGVPIEGTGPGTYVEVAEIPLGTTMGVRTCGRRLTGADGRMPPDQAVYRPIDDTIGAAEGTGDRTDDGPDNPLASWVPDDHSLVLLVADNRLFLLPSSRLATIMPAETAATVDWSRVIIANDLGTLLGLPPVGAGASRVVKAGPRLAVMLDAGRNPQRQPAAVYLDHLDGRMRDLGVSEVKAVILIHAHSDHVNELARVVQQYGISPTNVIVPREYLTTQPTSELQRSIQALQARFGPNWQPATLTLRPSTSRSELLTGRYTLGEMTLDFLAVGSAMRLERHTDSASLLARVTRRGEPSATLVLGDLRGRDLEAFQSLMGADKWSDFVKDVRVIDGFSHHGGRIEERDLPGLMRLLDATLVRSGRVSVTLQTDPGQHPEARADTLELLRRIGVEVHVANVALTTEPSGIRTTGTTVTTSGPATQSVAPVSSRLTETLARIDRLASARDVVAIWGPYIAETKQDFNTNAELARLDQSLDELRRTTREAITAALEVRVNGQRTTSGARDYSAGSSGAAFAAAIARIPQATVAETAIGEPTLTRLQSLREVPSNEVPLRVALNDALLNGRYSPQAFRYMITQLDPETLRGVFTGPRGGPRDLPSAWKRLRAEFGFRQAVLGDMDVMSAAHLTGVPRGVARGTAGVLLFIELANIAAQITQTYRISQANARNTNVVPFLRRIAFWRQLGVRGAEVAVDDGWTSTRFERDASRIDDGLRDGKWGFLYLEHTTDHPVLTDAEILKVLAVLAYNIRNYDEYATLFEDSNQDAIRYQSNGGPWSESRWEVCVGQFNTSGLNHIDERWVELPKLTEGMRALCKRVIANTRTLLERAGRDESTVTQELGVLQIPRGPILYRARLRAGVTSSNVELRPYVPPQWGGRSTPQPPLARQVTWQTGDRPQFFVWEESLTHVRVSGADFNTYVRLRDLKTLEYQVVMGQSDPMSPGYMNALASRVVGNEKGDAWILRMEVERV